MASPSLAVAFATIERPQVAQRLIRSVRKHFPDLAIYVADQSRHIDAASGFYESQGVNLVRMPYDAGVTASRNRLAEAIREEYFVLCDDDFVFGPQTGFRDALHILQSRPKIGVVGGKLHDFAWGEESIRNWELFLQYDKKQKILFSIPIYELAPKVRELGGIRYYLCDAVLNFALFRRAMFGEGVRWDERFKSNGEHEDFYLNLKENFSYLVAYLPTMIAYHHHPEEYHAYISRLRERSEGWKQFFEKWGLEQHVEFGLGVRTLDDLNSVVGATNAKARFFINADLSLRRTQSAPDTLVLGDYEKIAAVGALDATGNTADGKSPTATLLIDPERRRVLASPETNPGEAAAPADDPTERYRLESSDSSAAVSGTAQEIYFRHDAVLRADADFYLWYYCKGPRQERDPRSRRLAATVRWSADGDTILVWKSRRIYLELASLGYWQPLRLDVPLLPRGAPWVRFDLISDGGRSPDPIATGFLFAGPQHGNQPAGPAVAPFEVLGFTRLVNDGTSTGVAGKDIGELGRTCPERIIGVSSPAGLSAMRIFRPDAVPDLEALYFIGWESLGRPLVGVRLPAPTLDAPSIFALPSGVGTPSDGQIYGFGAALGLVRLALAEAGERAD